MTSRVHLIYKQDITTIVLSIGGSDNLVWTSIILYSSIDVCIVILCVGNLSAQ